MPTDKATGEDHQQIAQQAGEKTTKLNSPGHQFFSTSSAEVENMFPLPSTRFILLSRVLLSTLIMIGVMGSVPHFPRPYYGCFSFTS